MEMRMMGNEMEMKITEQDKMAVMQFLAQILFDHSIITDMEKKLILKEYGLTV